MIINQPTRNDFERVSKQCLTQAFEIVYGIDIELEYSDVDPADLWEYKIGDLSTCLILIYQAIEAAMKGRICETTPLLLLDLKRTDWPSLPQMKDRDFTEMYTISSEALVRTYFSVVEPTNQSSSLVKFVDDIRVTRNRIVHGPVRDYLDPEYLLNCILMTSTFFFGKGAWWSMYRQKNINNPVNRSVKKNSYESWFQQRLDYVESALDPVDFRAHFEINLNARRYYCPHSLCHSVESDLKSKWAFLVPQDKSQVKEVYCVSCEERYSVVRISCKEHECKGNVIFIDEKHNVCLTCGSQQPA